MVTKIVKSRATRAVVAVAMVAGVFAVASQSPTGAAPQSKTVSASCVGADPDSVNLVKVLSPTGSLALPITITSDVPATLQPEQSGSDIAFTWGVTLDKDTVNKAVALLPSLKVTNAQYDIGIAGPTSTKLIPSGPLPERTVNLVKDTPVTITEGPFTGKLEGVGKGGVIKYTIGTAKLTIVATVAGKVNNVNVTCSAPGTVAATLIKIPGSPDIAQPIEINGTANQKLTVDVLGKYVTDGKDEKGVVRKVDPSTLKVLDGPATVVNNQLEITPGATGTTSTTFEVCSGSLPGVNEVRTLKVDLSGFNNEDALKKGVAFTLKYGDAETPIIKFLPAEVPFTRPTNWVDVANSYIFPVFPFVNSWRQPTPESIQAALEATPGIGAGNVKVTLDPAVKGQYLIEFVGNLGQQEIKQPLVLGTYWSIFPQEIKSQLLALAGNLSPKPDAPTTTLPGGQTPEQYKAQLEAELQAALNAFNWDLAGEKFGALVQLALNQALANINVNEVTAFLNNLFTQSPDVAVKTQGESPLGICSQGVVDVKVAAVAGTTTTDTGTTANVAGISASKTGGSSLAFTG
ncbi:MAG: hypothetical protein ACOYOP_12340 [Microthrixaceae bacterium]